MACTDCHVPAAAGKPAQMRPGHENCTSCHETQITSECAYCHTDPDNIPPSSERVSDLIFPHEKHLAADGGGCEQCHAGIAAATAGEVVPGPTMGPASPATTTAAEQHLRALPQEFRDAAAAGSPCCGLRPQAPQRHPARLAQRRVRNLSHGNVLQDCHQGSGLKRFTEQDLMTDPQPRRFTQDSPDQTVLQNVHTLNYRFSHGIDARAHGSECLAATRSRRSAPSAMRPEETSRRVQSKPASPSRRFLYSTRPRYGRRPACRRGATGHGKLHELPQR